MQKQTGSTDGNKQVVASTAMLHSPFVINDLDETIKQILIKDVPLDPLAVDISFEMPTREWVSQRTRPTINAYLYDIRENLEKRMNEWLVARTEDGIVVRTKRPGRANLSYLITAWAKTIEDEHRLLGQVLSALYQFEHIHLERLEGGLRENQGMPLPAMVINSEALKSAGDFWGTMDTHWKPSINYQITVELEYRHSIAAPQIITRSINVEDMYADEEDYEDQDGRLHAVDGGRTITVKQDGQGAKGGTEAEGGQGKGAASKGGKGKAGKGGAGDATGKADGTKGGAGRPAGDEAKGGDGRVTETFTRPPLRHMIAGRVTQKGTSTPLEGVEIFLPEYGMSATTNVDGRFRFDRLLPGKYSAQAHALGYKDKVITFIIPSASPTAYYFDLEK